MYTDSLNMLVMPMPLLFKDNKNGHWERIISRTKALERDAGSSYAFNAYLYGITGHFLKFFDFFDLLYCFSRGLTWRKAFNYLRGYLETLPANEKLVVFFDEMPWMARFLVHVRTLLERLWIGQT